MRQNLDAWAFLLFTSVRKAATGTEIEPVSLSSAVQCLSHWATMVGAPIWFCLLTPLCFEQSISAHWTISMLLYNYSEQIAIVFHIHFQHPKCSSITLVKEKQAVLTQFVFSTNSFNTWTVWIVTGGSRPWQNMYNRNHFNLVNHLSQNPHCFGC